MRCRRTELMLLGPVLFLLFPDYCLIAPAIDGTHHEHQGQCHYYENQSFASGEFLTTLEVSSHECCATCWRHERCVAGTLHRGPCWLKDELAKPLSEPGRGIISRRLVGLL
jgi:hypothetical protein